MWGELPDGVCTPEYPPGLVGLVYGHSEDGISLIGLKYGSPIGGWSQTWRWAHGMALLGVWGGKDVQDAYISELSSTNYA